MAKAPVVEENERPVTTPGPGQYNIEKDTMSKPICSMFVSKVPRDSAGMPKRFSRTQQGNRAIPSQNLKSVGNRPLSSNPVDIDIFEDEEDEPPGPGSYYNPKTMSCFNVGRVPERLQFFGSTVDRFVQSKPTTASETT